MSRNILLIDSDFRRRAAITHCLEGPTFHIEPFEDARELTTQLPRTSALLVYGDAQALAAALDQMTEAGQWVPIICFAENPAIDDVVEALQSGASHFISSPFSEAELTHALEAIAPQFNSLGALRLREAKARKKVDLLTKREKDVLAAVADGLSNRMIGQRLSISPRTVEIHRSNMLFKMEARHTSEAIRIAIEAAIC